MQPDTGCFIYGLVDPRIPQVVQYVGKANDLDFRVYKHVWSAQHVKKGNTLLTGWLRGLLEKGLTPAVIVLKETTIATWQDDERAMIANWRAANPHLLNIADGGNGPTFNSPETRRRMAAAHTGLRHSIATRQAIADGQRGNKRGLETSNKLSASAKSRGTAHMNTPEARANKSMALKGRKKRPETIELLRAAALRRFAHQPGVKGMAGKKHSEETKVKMKAAHALRKAAHAQNI